MIAALVILAGALLLGWPIVLNGYPLVFIDTVSYLGQTLIPEWPWDKTPAYGAALHLFHWGVSLWPALLAQLLALSHLLWLTQRAARGEATIPGHLLLCGALAAFTSAPWFAATLMPDIFAAVAPLCILLLGFALERLTRGETAWLVILGAFATATHLSHLPTAVAMVLVVAVMGGGILPPLRAALPVALAVAALTGANAWAFGRASLSPHGAVFLLARLQADGPAAATIRANCPASGWYLCAFASRLPMDSDAFLWDPQSPPNRRPDGRAIAMGGMRLAPEAAQIIERTLRERPLEVAEAMLHNTFRQLAMTEVGDTLGREHLAASARRAIARLPPGELASFDAGAQMRGTLRQDAAPFLAVHGPALMLALPLALFALALAAWQRDRLRGGLVAGMLVAVLVNAFATGALSGPHNRYQARIIWLVPLAAVLGLAPRFGPDLNEAARIRARMAAWQTSSPSSRSSSSPAS
ncbi:hypothetical protein FHS88_002285 [Roseomonas alkaliterrae]|uniref:Glycosyltransferase RgtA/B/C/D-like domain-containing protein n=1 Tax=Neoroseomonas alkaliterrae TaxID=1452450 RepID=A0A840Y6C2_9PROT|nr:hypothetical protein [Neoroseomonas alkaliterrae]MBB5690152.1 hypothetical protein [Neoroseomonas alkaliterrae]